MDVRARVEALAKIRNAPTPVVSVYLDTRWTDQHQRERVRIFLKNEIQKAREAGTDGPAADDLTWIEAQGASIIDQERFPDAKGIALFACQALGLRDVIPARVPFDVTFVVAGAPAIGPLASMLAAEPDVLVLFIDSESARLIALTPEGAADEVALESEVPGHHRRGGWAQLAQSRYQRHIADHRGRHFDAVAAALVHLAESHDIARIIMAGEPRMLTAFRAHLPGPLEQRVVGAVAGSRHEPGATIAGRAAELLTREQRLAVWAEVDAVLTGAAKAGKAVAGLDPTVEAVNRGAVHRLYLASGFSEPGRICVHCQALQNRDSTVCRFCGMQTTAIDLGEAMVSRVVASGGTAERVSDHQAFETAGGVGALLRYPG